jgi:uncharacterized protein YutE (UPF0331/DUF86 family)
VLDRDRILVKLSELDGYLGELRSIAPESLAAYRQVEKRRACERLLQISVETVLDVCHLLVRGLNLGLPAEEDAVFEKLEQAAVISDDLTAILRRMKGCRNILVHEYGGVDDEIVFEIVRTGGRDFERFKREVLASLERHAPRHPTRGG